MEILIHDGSFEGYLSAVFYIYEYKLTDARICRQSPATALFGKTISIDTDEEKAARVWAGLSRKLTKDGLHTVFSTYLADTLAEEDTLLAYIRYVFSSDKNIEADFSNFAVLRMQRIERMVHREAHRMKAFIRFKLTKDNIYYDAISPDFNVIPLFKNHFEKRYADQQWIIYDMKRKYGIYYDGEKVDTITISFAEGNDPKGDTKLWMGEGEELYQTLWQQYFKSTNIASRKNMKLHIQHVPRRYWKYLSEKTTLGKDLL